MNSSFIGAPALVVTCVGEGIHRQKAIALAQSLGLPYANDTAPTGTSLILAQTESQLELQDAQSGARLIVEFTPAELRRYRSGGGGPNPLRRAIGPGPRSVLDATGGLGRDAVHLAVLGYAVTAIERHPIVSALAQHGLTHARESGLLPYDNPIWHTGDAREVMQAISERPQTVYLDPMFPPKRKKTAAVRKEMQMLRRLLVGESDAGELFAAALACAAERVVVKRPDEAPPLAGNPTTSYRGKLVRYDVYYTKAP